MDSEFGGLSSGPSIDLEARDRFIKAASSTFSVEDRLEMCRQYIIKFGDQNLGYKFAPTSYLDHNFRTNGMTYDTEFYNLRRTVPRYDFETLAQYDLEHLKRHYTLELLQDPAIAQHVLVTVNDDYMQNQKVFDLRLGVVKKK